MAYFRSKFQIFYLFTSKKSRYNPFFLQQPWQCVRPLFFSKRSPIEDPSSKGSTSTDIETRIKTSSKSSDFGQKNKRRILNFGRTKKKPIDQKEQKPLKKKLTLWEHMFGPNVKKSQSDSHLVYHHKQVLHTKNAQLDNSRYQIGEKNELLHNKQIRSSKKSSGNLKPKSAPSFKLPRAVLCKMIVEGLDKENQVWETKLLIKPKAPKKPYEELKPSPDIKRIIKHNKSEDLLSYKEPINYQTMPQVDIERASTSITKIFHQTAEEEKSRIFSRMEQLKSLVDKKFNPNVSSSSRVNRE